MSCLLSLRLLEEKKRKEKENPSNKSNYHRLTYKMNTMFFFFFRLSKFIIN